MRRTALLLSACAALGACASAPRSEWVGTGVMSFSSAEQYCRNEARVVLEASRPSVFQSCMARNGWRREAAPA